jgi:hypothetical protein
MMDGKVALLDLEHVAITGALNIGYMRKINSFLDKN